MRLAIKMVEDGTLSDLDLDAAEGPLSVLQEAVEGYIECITVSPVGQTLDMWLNEEGLYLLADRHNPYASLVMQDTYGQGYINGPVVFTGGVDEEGETLGLTQTQAAVLKAAIAQIL